MSDSTRRKRLWLWRLLAVCSGLLAFVVVEAVCRVADVGKPDLSDDPFVGFSHLQPLFVNNVASDSMRIAPARLRYFAPESFPVRKPAGATRIFVLGGSTVQGRPFSTPTSFPTWLELALKNGAAGERDQWNVINCGGVSYASYRLVPILSECLAYEPDLFIICCGHNEFLEDRSYGDIRDQSPLLAMPHQYLTRLRSYQLYRGLLLGSRETAAPDRSTLPDRVDALLDYRDGLAAYHRDPVWRDGVIQHFEFNLRRMMSLAAEHSIPVLLIRPPSNLADQPPFKSEHCRGFSASDQKQFDELLEAARQKMVQTPLLAVRTLEAARDLDPEFAAVRYQLGRLYELVGRFDDARAEFLAAREQDICPLRMLLPMEASLAAVARDFNVPLLDAHALLTARTKHGILDGSQLVDHVHPSFAAHQQIAIALVKQLADQQHVTLLPDWEQSAREAFEKHFESLPDYYFADGQRNLDNLLYWTRGESDGPDVSTREIRNHATD